MKKEEENNDMETTSEVEIKAEPETKLNKVKVTAGKKSKKSQKEELADELKALAEEANEADIEMKLEPDSEEKPKPRQTKASKKAAKKSDEKSTKDKSPKEKSPKEKSPIEK